MTTQNTHQILIDTSPPPHCCIIEEDNSSEEGWDSSAPLALRKLFDVRWQLRLPPHIKQPTFSLCAAAREALSEELRKRPIWIRAQKYTIEGILTQMKFPQILRQERELRGWSQARTAQELGTTPNTISAWERGLSLPSPYFREKLCTLFDKNAQEWGLLPVDDHPVGTLQQEEVAYAAPLQVSPTNRLYSRRNIIFLACLLALLISSTAIIITWPLITSPNPYAAGKGRLTLYDPLKDQGQHLNWQEGWNENGAFCQFKRDAYYSTQPREGYFHACIAQATSFHNFAYEVKAMLYHGDYVGIIFRATNSLDSKYYLFRVQSDGTYMLKRYVDRVDEHAILLDSGTAEQFHKGPGQTNKLAVVAVEQHLTLYINQQQVTSVTDQAYSDGQIGVLAGNENHPPAEAAFRDAKVWSW